MLGTFLERATTLLGRRFIITAWAPTFVVTALTAVVMVALLGWQRVATSWSDLDPASQAAVSVGALLALTAAAFILQTLPIVRLFEGYYHPQPFRQWALRLELRRFEKLQMRVRKEHQAAVRPAYRDLYRTLPLRREWVLPTRLGNVLRAAETYSSVAYGADAVHWWPRLVQVIGDKERTSLDEALMPMVALLNAAALVLAATFAASAFVVVSTDHEAYLIAVYAVGLLLTMLAYRGSVSQAEIYGEAVRATMDVHRTKILASLRVSKPANIAEERAIWGVLEDWLYNMSVPMEPPQGSTPGDRPWEKRPFEFAEPSPAPPAEQQEA